MFKNLFKPKPTDFIAPMSGTLMNIERVPDEVFASKSVGDGFAIEMDNDTVVSPCNGKVVAVFPTGHAIGIKSDDRNEYLIHIGLDTVTLQGQGFHVCVELDQVVKAGDCLVKIDRQVLQEKQVSLVCPIIVTNANSRKIRLLKEGHIEQKEKDFLAITA